MPADPDRYPPIADYAVLSDCHSAALVSRSGSVDWACLRRFDHASAFGRLLDWDRGGSFRLTPLDVRRTSRRYLGDSLVLETRVEAAGGEATVTEAFSMHEGGAERPYHQLLRVVEGLHGTVEFDVHIEPRFDYGELHPWLRAHPDEAAAAARVWSAVGGDSALVLTASCPLDVDDVNAVLTGRLRVEAGQRHAFSAQAQRPHELDATGCPPEQVLRRLDETRRWWEGWSAGNTAGGRYEEQVRRSAVVLKGLSCGPTGAMVAAPTTSLPEHVGGERNWDYRYTWIRDSTLVLAALELAGHPREARRFRDFILRATAGSPEDMQIMYGIYGERYIPEIELDLEGYRGSQPVRIGNAAFRQVQHDMYGQVLDAAHLWRHGHEDITEPEWRFLRRLVDRAARVWKEPDQGIWEFRTEPRHFVHSKVWLWVALDRGVRLAEETGHAETVDVAGWRQGRDEIRAAIDAHGVHPHDGHFVQSFGSTEVDAALLELPMVGFVPATDERMVRTVEVIERDLTLPPRGFVRRYRAEYCDDGLPGEEGAFLMCTFWLVDVLAMQGRVEDARRLFERLLGVANDLGLFSEQHDADADEMVGNFPQAFTHMALINSAHQIACAEAHPGPCRDQVWSTADRMEEREL
jgi:GH15 family glucan-1,4-alpha-glucosidase